MVYFKIKIHILLTFVLIVGFSSGCQSNRAKQNIKDVALQRDEGYNFGDNNYCFGEVLDSLMNIDLLKPSKETHYRKVERSQLTQGKYKVGPEVEEFYDYTTETEAYVLEYKGNSYLIMIGQAVGATGKWGDYRNYRCYLLGSNKESLAEFGSLANTPFTIFINDNGELSYIAIDDNYPRPADGSEVVLNHYPTYVSVYTGDSLVTEFEYKCYGKRSD
ncbi:hypothetical protein [Pontibacter cellulosilyticus]|uniref:Lipoprotein n=1 Tax=Pontibacter cellulosilyticus TaxID=1720253 RepID=A0A923NB85_9BACT|nr:hypothetical protein [Pontibacter cellulosilyticus]MBC5994726.1 hypothetical protein [Pontibacter cellulosilyticus]